MIAVTQVVDPIQINFNMGFLTYPKCTNTKVNTFVKNGSYSSVKLSATDSLMRISVSEEQDGRKLM